jgi:hypothetical protein
MRRKLLYVTHWLVFYNKVFEFFFFFRKIPYTTHCYLNFIITYMYTKIVARRIIYAYYVNQTSNEFDRSQINDINISIVIEISYFKRFLVGLAGR